MVNISHTLGDSIRMQNDFDKMESFTLNRNQFNKNIQCKENLESSSAVSACDLGNVCVLAFVACAQGV